jgi:Fe-S-cluster containining protein
MPANENYIRMRKEVLEFDEGARQYCLCKGINGGCCKRDLRLLPEDEEVILEAVKRGDIDPTTLQRATLRARDASEAFCPFLGERGECTIYPHRPIVCMQHGNGGLPKDKAVARRALERPGNRTIKVSELEQFSCDACAEHVGATDRIPLSIVGRSVAILLTIQQGQRHYGSRTMNQFLTELASES